MLKIEQKLAFKLCIFGAGGVGKTTLIRRFVTRVFEKDIKMTIGADFSVKNISHEGRTITLRIWDFAGEDRFRVLLPAFAKGADGGIFMFDLTRYSSIKDIEDWLSIFEYFISDTAIKKSHRIVQNCQCCRSNILFHTDELRQNPGSRRC